MVEWTAKNVKSVKHFLWGIDSIHEGEPLITTFRPQDLADELVVWHREHYSYQHNDTIRSYTQQGLRKSGNHGKRKDFAYFNRAYTFFGYDQFAAHRAQPNKLICIWDPSKQGDMVGEHNPCMVLVKFQKRNGKLDLSVVFRKRDLLSRMVGNWAMLVMWLNNEAGMQKLKPGWLIDYSMDTTYDVKRLEELRKAK